MATSVLNSSAKRATPLAKTSDSGDDSSFSTRRSASRRYRSLSRFSHRMPDPDPEVTPTSKGKFVNTVRGSGFSEINLDDLAVEFFESFSSESGISSGERGRPGSKNSAGGEAKPPQRRGRSVSRTGSGSNGGLRRLDADTESSRRRRSLSRQPSTREVSVAGKSLGLDPGSSNSNRRRSVSRQPRERIDSVAGDREKENPRRRRSLSVVPRRIDNSESDVDRIQCARDVKKSPHKPAATASDHRQGHRRSFSQNPVNCHDGYSSHSSAVTDDEGKEYGSSKHGTERIIRTVYAQNKATPKKRESLVNGSQRKSLGDHRHAISTVKKGYATKLQESEERKQDLLAEIMLEEQRGRELSMNLKELLSENSSEVNSKPLRMRKRSDDWSSRMSMCLTDEAEQYIEEFISNIEDTDLSSFEDERSESSSSLGLIKTPKSSIVRKSIPVEMDGVMLPWLQWESDSTKDASSGQGMSSSRGSWSPYESETKLVNPIRRLKIDVSEYLKRPNSSDILNETWKLRHRINSGSLVLSSRSLI